MLFSVDEVLAYMSEIKTVNPFDYLPNDKLEIILDDYKRDICQEKSF